MYMYYTCMYMNMCMYPFIHFTLLHINKAKSSTKNGSTNTDPTSEERKNSTSGEDGRKTDKNTSLPDPKKDKKSVSKKKSSKKDPGPPIEAQPPPGPLVALGKPRDKSIKRPRSVGFNYVTGRVMLCLTALWCYWTFSTILSSLLLSMLMLRTLRSVGPTALGEIGEGEGI